MPCNRHSSLSDGSAKVCDSEYSDIIYPICCGNYTKRDRERERQRQRKRERERDRERERETERERERNSD